jgi:GNAT superfamily N-acetyltransferase
MPLTLRPGRPEDAPLCGTICYEAFKTIAEQHNFPPGYPSPEAAVARMAARLAHPGFYAVVAELDGCIVGSNFLDERSPIAGLGPITVDPAVQNRAIGRHLMHAVLERAKAQHFQGVRLLHATYHTRALSLYAKCGFVVRDLVAKVTGGPLTLQLPDSTVRPGRLTDLEPCNQLCQRVHGHDRGGELRDALQHGTATVVEHNGCLSGYFTGSGVSGPHAVGETTATVEALMAAEVAVARGTFRVPLRNGELLQWCLGHGLRVEVPETLMSLGFYQEPAGAFLPSGLY